MNAASASIISRKLKEAAIDAEFCFATPDVSIRQHLLARVIERLEVVARVVGYRLVKMEACDGEK